MSSVLIIGCAKSGTSALYSLIKNSMGEGLFVYEPSTKAQFSYIKNSSKQKIVAKSIFEHLNEDTSYLKFFSKNILIIRDPRDTIISDLLYQPLLKARYYNDEFVSGFINLLKQKEANPKSISILDLYDYLKTSGSPGKTDQELSSLLIKSKYFHQSLPDCFLFKYEDLLNDNISKLEKHLGFSLLRDTKLSSHISYNARQKKAGVWKNWFTHDDVSYFKPLINEYIRHYNYDISWELEPNPTLDAAYGSEYIIKSTTRLKKLPNQFGDLKCKSLYTTEYLDHLESAANEGAEGAMLELALATLASYKNSHDHNKIFSQHLEKAVERNNPLALIYKGVAIEHEIIKPIINCSPSDFYLKSAKQIGNVKCKRWIEHVREEIKKITTLS